MMTRVLLFLALIAPCFSAEDVPQLGHILIEDRGTRLLAGFQASLGWISIKDEASLALIRVSEQAGGRDLTQSFRITAEAGLSSLMIRCTPGAVDFGTGNTIHITIPRAAMVSPFDGEDLVLSVSTDVPVLPNP